MVYYTGSPIKPGSVLELAIDGKKLADLPVLDHDLAPSGINTVMVDVPGQIFADVLVPGLKGGSLIQADVGGRRFTTTTGRFDRAMRQLVECTQMFLGVPTSGRKAS